eukprot:TRINITY_DN47120_c0_g1_i1.p2 TRINITY_DN47120_c0_g1~~TRINITY_DN47120_c0_g1_i1.p2  ORF type:complete len:170 (-),score=48.99 TRINITY_DN47120_c0_g1_i1:62-571(-)
MGAIACIPHDGACREHEEAFAAIAAAEQRLLEARLQHLFGLFDLNRNGTLEEPNLVKLNQRIASMHQGAKADGELVRVKYERLFRSELDPVGRPVPYATFRRYMLAQLRFLDEDIMAQSSIIERFIAEAALVTSSRVDMDDGHHFVDGRAALVPASRRKINEDGRIVDV